MKLFSYFAVVIGTVYASVATINAPSWFGNSTRNHANRLNGIAALTILEIMSVLALLSVVGGAGSFQAVDEAVAVCLALILFTVNYVFFVVKESGDKYISYFLGLTRTAKISIRLSLVIVFVLSMFFVAGSAEHRKGHIREVTVGNGGISQFVVQQRLNEV